MHMWFDVMRDIEHVMEDYGAVFDGWQAGGVTGMVIGPLTFDSPDLVKVQEPPGHAPVPKERPPTDTFDPQW